MSDFGPRPLTAASEVLLCSKGPAWTSIRDRADWTSERTRFCLPRPASVDFFRIARDTA
jgi:hypothetical protein